MPRITARIVSTLTALVGLCVTGCGGAGSPLATSAVPSGASIAVDVHVEQRSTSRTSQSLSGVNLLVFHVLNADSRADSIPPVSIAVSGSGPVSESLGNVPLGGEVLHVDAFAASTLIGSAETGTLTIVPGTNIAPPLTITLGSTAAPTHLAFTLIPTVRVGARLPAQVQVEVRDANDQVVVNNSDPITLTSDDPGAQLEGTATVNATNGVATFSNADFIISAFAGSQHTLHLVASDATSSAVTSATSGLISVSPIDPIFPALTPDGRFLYVANDVFDTVTGYAVNQNTGALSLLPNSPFAVTISSTADFERCTVSPDGRFFFLSDPPDGNVIVCAIDSAGNLTPVNAAGFPLGLGPQTPVDLAIDATSKFIYGSRGVQLQGDSIAADGFLSGLSGFPLSVDTSTVDIDPSNRFFFDVNGAQTEVVSFTLDASTGQLTALATTPLSSHSSVGTAVGSATFSPDGSAYFVASTGTIEAFSVSASGTLTEATGSPFSTSPQGNEDLVVDAAGHFVYATVPNQNLLLGFSIGSGAVLTPLNAGQPVATGAEPFGMATQQIGSQELLYVTNRNDSTVSAFVIDPITGALSEVAGSPFKD